MVEAPHFLNALQTARAGQDKRYHKLNREHFGVPAPLAT